MKFLHLSDLHIGKSINGFSMLEEQKNAFRQIIEYIRTERPDVVLIAGDVYDRSVPGVEAVCVFDDFLTNLAKENATVLIISGNHDSPERLCYANRLLSDKNLYLYGTFNDLLKKITLKDEQGVVIFWLLPFVRPSMFHGVIGEHEVESYNDVIAAILADEEINYNERNVLLSHQFYTSAGKQPERCESEMDSIGGLDAIDVSLISRFDYAALGHLHSSQRVGSDHIRYAGSPIKYSFSECRHNKSITLIELCEKGKISIKFLPIKPIHDMREIKGNLDKLISDDIVSQADHEDYIRVILTDEEEIIDPMGKLRSVYPNVMALDFDNTSSNINIADIEAKGEHIEKLSQYELFCEFYLAVTGATMTAEQDKLIRELFDEVVNI